MPACPRFATTSEMEQESDAMLLDGERMRLMEHSSSSPRSNQEQGTGSRSTPVRFVLEERLARMPAQEMVVHLLFVKLNLADGQWLVLFHGVLDVLLSYLVSVSEFYT